MSFECNLNFELIGTLIGMAIYNSVLLDLHLPTVVYKKLLGQQTDLKVQTYDSLGYPRV